MAYARFARIVLCLLSISICTCALAADPRPDAGASAQDHPLGLVAFASLDRLRARVDSLTQTLGLDVPADEWLKGLTGDEFGPLLNSPGLDTTRPFGIMTFPKWTISPPAKANEEQPDQPEEAIGVSHELPEFDPESLIDGVASLFVENATMAVCFPVKDRQLLLDAVCQMLNDTELTPVETEPGWYQPDEDKKNVRIGFVGSYLLVVNDDGPSKNFYRNYPEFDKLARSSLGKNGFVFAAYRKGLPMFVRDIMAPAFKMAFAARFQKQDEETDLEFRLRTFSGASQMELVDLALSHVEEVRITGHVDAVTHSIVIEPEIIGRKGGKLAKYCNGWKGAGNPFAGLATDADVLSASLSLPLPAKETKPLADALFAQSQTLKQPETVAVIRALVKTIESGQLDLYTVNPNWSEGAVAVRISGGPQFPEQFEKMLASFTGIPPFQLAVDSVEGIPIHRSRTSLPGPLPMMLLSLSLQLLADGEPALPSLSEEKREVSAVMESLVEEKGPDGKLRMVTQSRTQSITFGGDDTVWLAVTPNAIWVACCKSESTECPDWFKAQIAASLGPPDPAIRRVKNVFQIALRALGAASDFDIQQVKGDDEQIDEKARVRGELLRDLPNAVKVELKPTETGGKLTVKFEEAYFRWFAAYVRDSIENGQANQPANAQPAPVIEPAPK